jgi:hypothetical protein
MLESPAMRVLSLSARRVLDRLEIELAHHGGGDNGNLPTTYEHFEEYGMDRDCIAPAIRELVALGFVEVTEQGRAGNAEHRAPNRFRLTYRETDKAKPTDDWRKIATLKEAHQIAVAARRASAGIWAARGRQKKISSGGSSVISVGKTPTENRQTPVRETPTTVHSRKTPTTSISRAGVRPYTNSHR